MWCLCIGEARWSPNARATFGATNGPGLVLLDYLVRCEGRTPELFTGGFLLAELAAPDVRHTCIARGRDTAMVGGVV